MTMSETPWPKHIQVAAVDACREYLEGGENGRPLAQIIASALHSAQMEERERCAKMVEEMTWFVAVSPDHVRARSPDDIATAIRTTKAD